uniref:Integral membrane protein n=1 Tax=Parastrongyloides trichosuri TaxID=131310 RepID=A0A0N4Z6U4_PARTI
MVTIVAWIVLIIGPYYLFTEENAKIGGIPEPEKTPITKWGEYNLYEMYVPVCFLPIAMIFPMLGMFLVRNFLKKNLSSRGKIILIIVSMALYAINGAAIHYGIRNISLNSTGRIHAGWYGAAGLVWLGLLLLLANILVIYCTQIKTKEQKEDELNPSGISGSLSRSSGASGSSKVSGSSNVSGSTRKSGMSKVSKTPSLANQSKTNTKNKSSNSMDQK